MATGSAELIEGDESVDRVRAHTAQEVLARLDRELEARVRLYATQPEVPIRRRIEELEREWDIERTLEYQASITAGLGALLTAFVDRRWLWLVAVNQLFLFQHASRAGVRR
jgi:hypothetical protein